MKRKYILAGIGALFAGAVVYWYLQSEKQLCGVASIPKQELARVLAECATRFSALRIGIGVSVAILTVFVGIVYGSRLKWRQGTMSNRTLLITAAVSAVIAVAEVNTMFFGGLLGFVFPCPVSYATSFPCYTKYSFLVMLVTASLAISMPLIAFSRFITQKIRRP